MPNWRRAHVPGGTYFFTVVTDRRRPLFADPSSRQTLGDVIRECRLQWPFDVHSIVLLPDHLHAIWSLPRGDADYSKRWAWIKRQFTKCWLVAGGTETGISEGRRRDGRRCVWQPKFWEHTIEDEGDMERHVDYIHYNPVKHGYARCPVDWPWSSFHKWVQYGAYPSNWGCSHREALTFDDLESSVGE
jgi:putative transposase